MGAGARGRQLPHNCATGTTNSPAPASSTCPSCNHPASPPACRRTCLLARPLPSACIPTQSACCYKLCLRRLRLHTAPVRTAPVRIPFLCSPLQPAKGLGPTCLRPLRSTCPPRNPTSPPISHFLTTQPAALRRVVFGCAGAASAAPLEFQDLPGSCFPLFGAPFSAAAHPCLSPSPSLRHAAAACLAGRQALRLA